VAEREPNTRGGHSIRNIKYASMTKWQVVPHIQYNGCNAMMRYTSFFFTKYGRYFFGVPKERTLLLTKTQLNKTNN
jgi:hypothetical protein